MTSAVPKLGSHFLLAALLGVLLVNIAAQAAFSLKEYQQWQAYNGWRIRVIEFPGIRSFSRAELLAVTATDKPTWLRRYVRIGRRTLFYADDFASDILRIERFYEREGFPNSSVKATVTPDPKRRELKLKLEIHEGPPIILESWQIVMGSDSGAGVDSARWSKRLLIRVGARLAQSDLIASADTLRAKLAEVGHARARVTYSVQIDSLRHRARLTFLLYPGHFCFIGQTQIDGLKQVSEGTARRELDYDEFSPFRTSKLEKARRNLIKLETFSFVGIRADTAAPGDTLAIAIRVEEGARYRLRVGGGYVTTQGARASSEFTDLNFFGRGRKLTVTGTYAEFNRKAGLRLFWPHTPLHETDITLAPAWESQSEAAFELQSTTNSTILSAAPLERVRASVGNEFGYVQKNNRTQEDKTRTRYIKSTETFSAAWDTRDNPLLPRDGHFLSLTLTESGALYRTDLRWWRGSLAGRLMYPVNKFTVFAGKADAGLMGALYETHTTPTEERFYLGSSGSVRGWKYHSLAPRVDADPKTPIGGDFTYSLTLELRRDIWGPVGVAVFADAGNVWRHLDSSRPLDLYPSAGAGLSFSTPVGPLRVDYARQLRANPFGDTPWAIHLSVGTPF